VAVRKGPRGHGPLTGKGQDLVPVLFALMAWGDRWAAGREGPPMWLRHQRCGQRTTPQVTCTRCGQPLALEEVAVEAGPGGHPGRWLPSRHRSCCHN
jgi:hypothetical protein